ncbi:MAG: helix-turn-helix transcriptional regulator [Acidobacteria bacterium]|nr:helix-turn-helix transcriptional regulator [Acidobacteriota bacterium]
MEQRALLLIGPAGQVIAMDPAARLILEEGDGLRVEDNFLHLPSWSAEDGQPLTISRPSGRPPWNLLVTPLMNGSSDVSFRAVTIYDAMPERESEQSLLKEAFRLTKAELRLADQLLAGRTPAEAAESLGVSIHTVRTYLKRLYGKVGVRNQAGLVRALMMAVQPPPMSAQCAG